MPHMKKPGADTEDKANYRPITNLNTIENIFERLAQKQHRRHIEESSNIGSQQSVYRALHSTETTITKVVNDLLSQQIAKHEQYCWRWTSVQPSILLTTIICSNAPGPCSASTMLFFIGCSPISPVANSSFPSAVSNHSS